MIPRITHSPSSRTVGVTTSVADDSKASAMRPCSDASFTSARTKTLVSTTILLIPAPLGLLQNRLLDHLVCDRRPLVFRPHRQKLLDSERLLGRYFLLRLHRLQHDPAPAIDDLELGARLPAMCIADRLRQWHAPVL